MPEFDTGQIVAPHAETEGPPRRQCRGVVFFLSMFVLALAAIVAWGNFVDPPNDFPTQRLIVITLGATAGEVSALLEEEHVVRSRVAFALLVRYRGVGARIIAGEYIFPSTVNLFGVIDRLLSGEHGIKQVRVIIPEGTSVTGMGRILAGMLSKFDHAQFVSATKGSEGYLFPDTYFFFSTATSGPVIDTLKNNFLFKTGPLHAEALANKKNWSDLITMASIIEEEAKTAEDRRLVSGILWKRLAKHMRLQVDSPFAYDIGKNSSSLTTVDLNVDSPYNTYRYGGLPPTPISNPGLDAIDAALHPELSPYFYYLSGKDGVIHYAKTFEEHKLNKERYLE